MENNPNCNDENFYRKKIIPLVHSTISIPVIGHIYDPASQLPNASSLVKLFSPRDKITPVFDFGLERDQNTEQGKNT